MKKLIFIAVALFSFLLISCGDKERKVDLTHEEYFGLLKAAAMGEVLQEFRKKDSIQMENQKELILKAGKADALELLISEGWRPKDCCCEKKEIEDNYFDYGYPKKYQRFPQGSHDIAPRSLVTEEKKDEPYCLVQPSPLQYPYITNAPVINNYCCGSGKKEEEAQKVEPQKEQSSTRVDTLIKKVLPWELEFGAGFSKGPVGSLRFGNNRAEVGGIFLWNKENKTANSLVDFVLKPKDGMGFRYGVFYHNEISPQKWNIPNQKTTSVSAGGVTTVLNSTSNVEVEQWNVSKQTLGPVFGLQGGDEKFFLSTDVMPALTISKNSPGVDDFTVNARVFGGYYVSPKTLLGLNVGLINRELYPTLSLRFLPGLEKTTK